MYAYVFKRTNRRSFVSSKSWLFSGPIPEGGRKSHVRKCMSFMKNLTKNVPNHRRCLESNRNTVERLYNHVLGDSEIIRYIGHFVVKVAHSIEAGWNYSFVMQVISLQRRSC